MMNSVLRSAGGWGARRRWGRAPVHTLPGLPYAPNSLEPVICSEIMELHHQKHHGAYVANLNEAEKLLKEALGKGDLTKAVALQPGFKFNAGGHLNHSIFWKNLSPCGGKPSEELTEAACQAFASFDDMKDKLRLLCNSVQGSGWGWLGFNPYSAKLQLTSTKDQDPLEATTGLVPLLGIDVWEHAYYIQYKNSRSLYTKHIFDVVNWNDINARFLDAKCNVR